jgi:3-deoxy-manno-octulosonate cytidylyltransferase (CMP-KDO synthetase)
MVWWVYQRAKQALELSDVIVATDSERIAEACHDLDMKVVLTSAAHATPADRIHEVSDKIGADLFVEINGDEPLIAHETISSVIPSGIDNDLPFVAGLYSVITAPVDAIDPTNLKVAVSRQGLGLYISRLPIPFPKGSSDFEYKKYVGVVAFNKKALDIYVELPRGELESAEDMDLLRFIENGIPVRFSRVDCEAVSVDTQKDLEIARRLLAPPPPHTHTLSLSLS